MSDATYMEQIEERCEREGINLDIYELGVLANFGSYHGLDVDLVSDWAAEATDTFQGVFGSDEEFAQQMCDTIGTDPYPSSWPFTCIDWDAAAHELMYDYFEEEGYYYASN